MPTKWNWLMNEVMVKVAVGKAKMQIGAKGTCSDKDALNEAIFFVVRAKMADAKEQKKIAPEMKAALMKELDTGADWEIFERKHLTACPKNRAGSDAHKGSKTKVTCDTATQRSVANTVVKVPKKINEAMFHCRMAQNDMIKQALLESARGKTRRRSFNKPAAKRARMMVDMNVDHFGAKGAVSGARNTKKENR